MSKKVICNHYKTCKDVCSGCSSRELDAGSIPCYGRYMQQLCETERTEENIKEFNEFMEKKINPKQSEVK